MQWRFKRLHYDILVPKLGKSIFALNEEEAADYYNWFVGRIPERVAYVSEICAKELHIPLERMDCSPESLVLIWKWFLKRAKTETIILSKEEKNHPAFANGTFRNKHQLTLESEYIIRDIGMYLGETFRKNHPQIYWTYYTKPKRNFFVNHPLLKGFVSAESGIPRELEFEPIHMARVQAASVLNHSAKETDLLKIYNIWAKMT
jgi:hypothetical protein